MESERGREARQKTAAVVNEQLLDRARAGDGEAFQELTDPIRRELHLHCYRMLGSLQDAEDALQDTMLSAWQGIAGFEGRASLRTWLYRVATNRCLNQRRAATRQPKPHWPVPDVEPPEPTRLSEVTWLEPYPDAYLADLPASIPGPEARLETLESIALAFVSALQQLPPRQRAVLVLRDALGFRAEEVANMLDVTVDSVTSALKRARAAVKGRAESDHARPAAPGSAEEVALIARLTHAYETGDVDELVALLTDDVVVAMPPVPLEYEGLELAFRFHHDVVFRGGRTYTLVPTRANGQPAFGAYVRPTADGPSHALGLLVFTLVGDRVCAITRFDTVVFEHFGLPRSLPKVAPRRTDEPSER